MPDTEPRKLTFVFLVEVEAGLERQAMDRRAYRLAADLKRVARQTEVADRPRTVELHRAQRAHVFEHPAGATGTVEAGKCEHLADDELARLIGVHHPGKRRRDYCPGCDRTQYKTRKHAVTPTLTQPRATHHPFTRCLPY